MKDAVEILNKRIAELEEDIERLKKGEKAADKEIELLRKHGPILISIIEELVDDATDLGTLGEGPRLRINEALNAAIGDINGL
jgi:hypothetical protein